MPPHPLTNFEIQKYHQNEPKFNGVYSRNNLTKIKDGAYVINLDEFKSIGNHWITGHKNITMNINRIQADDSVMCGYFCIGFIDFTLKGKSFLEYINLFSPNEYKKSEKIILKYFL